MDIEAAKKVAAKLISYKMYTCSEVFKRLVQKGCDSETAEMVVAEFCRAGILNDEEYAKMYIHDASAVSLKGMFRIRQELLAKGIAASVVERAIADSEVDTEAQLESYVELRFGDRIFSDYKDIEKAKAHLARRGFSIPDINRVFKKLNITVKRGGR